MFSVLIYNSTRWCLTEIECDCKTQCDAVGYVSRSDVKVRVLRLFKTDSRMSIQQTDNRMGIQQTDSRMGIQETDSRMGIQQITMR